MPMIPGVRFATDSCAVKYRGRKDVMLAAFDKGTQVAGVFTQSKTAAAPVYWCKRQAAKGRARALIVNAGNANAFPFAAGEASLYDRYVRRASFDYYPLPAAIVGPPTVCGCTAPWRVVVWVGAQCTP